MPSAVTAHASVPATLRSRNGPLRTVPGLTFTLAADMVVKAIGQEPLLDLLKALPGLRVAGGSR